MFHTCSKVHSGAPTCSKAKTSGPPRSPPDVPEADAEGPEEGAEEGLARAARAAASSVGAGALSSSV